VTEMKDTNICIVLRKSYSAGQKQRKKARIARPFGHLFDGNLSTFFPGLRKRICLRDLVD